MGYGPEYFAGAVNNWIENKWLPLNGRIVEFGAQEFYCDQDEARGATEKFLRARGISDEAIRMALPKGEPVAVSKVYRALGIDYLAIDVDRAFGSQFYDLNTFAPAPNWRGAFDLVNNEGTIEHLINPINGFQVAHELLKVDGVAIHSMPLTGWIDHGLTYPTIKFYAELIGTNRYEMLRGEILISQSPLDFADARFVLRDRDDGRTLEDVGHLKLTNAWIRLTVRKTNDAEFRIPFDHLLVDRPQELGNHAAYSRTRLTENWLSGLANDAGPKAVEVNAAVGLLERIRSRFRSG